MKTDTFYPGTAPTYNSTAGEALLQDEGYIASTTAFFLGSLGKIHLYSFPDGKICCNWKTFW